MNNKTNIFPLLLLLSYQTYDISSLSGFEIELYGDVLCFPDLSVLDTFRKAKERGHASIHLNAQE